MPGSGILPPSGEYFLGHGRRKHVLARRCRAGWTGVPEEDWPESCRGAASGGEVMEPVLMAITSVSASALMAMVALMLVSAFMDSTKSMSP